MAIVISCPNCGTKLRVQDDSAGRKVPCPKCQEPITVPEADSAYSDVEEKVPPKPASRPAPRRRPDDDEDDRSPRRSRREPDYLPPPKRSSTGDKTALTVVLIVGGIVLAVLIVCVGGPLLMFYMLFSTASNMQQAVMSEMEKAQKEQADRKAQEEKEKKESKDFALTFLKEVKEGHPDAAYAMTSKAYQLRMASPDFEELLKKKRLILQKAFTLGEPQPVTGVTKKYTLTVSGDEPPPVEPGKPPQPARKTILTLTLVKDDDGWKVDDFK